MYKSGYLTEIFCYVFRSSALEYPVTPVLCQQSCFEFLSPISIRSSLTHSEMNIQDLVLMEIILELGKNGKEKHLCQFSCQCTSLACGQAAFQALFELCHCDPPSLSTPCTSMSTEPFAYVLA